MGNDPGVDWYLAEYVTLANKGLRFPVTLYCHGFLLSGILIGGREYFEMAAKEVHGSFPDSELKDVMSNWVSGWADMYPLPSQSHEKQALEDEQAPGSAQGDDDEPASTPGFLHLMHAQVFTPGQAPIPATEDGMLWRGRLSSIDGFTWGLLAGATSSTVRP